MEPVLVYQFRVYDAHSDQMRMSRRWGTREAVEKVARGEVVEASGVYVNPEVIESDIPGMSAIGFDPRPRRTGFQTRVEN